MQIKNDIFEDYEKILVGPSNVDAHYPMQSAEYIKNYTDKKNRLFEYISEVELDIDKLNSKKIKNNSRMKNYLLEINKSELTIELIDELIELWYSQQIITQDFYSNFQLEKNHDLDCYDFIVRGDTINGQQLVMTKINSNTKESYYEIIDDKILRITGELNEEEQKKWSEYVAKKRSYKSLNFKNGIANYKIYETNLDSCISWAKYSYKYTRGHYSRKNLDLDLELEDSEFVKRMEDQFPTFFFDLELSEMYREVKYESSGNYIRLALKGLGEQIIPEKWIKIRCN